MKRRGLCIALVALVAASAPALGAYPERPVRVIVPFSPGGTSDFVGRIVGEALSNELKQQMVVDNRGGAGSALGTQLAARATPDGTPSSSTTSDSRSTKPSAPTAATSR